MALVEILKMAAVREIRMSIACLLVCQGLWAATALSAAETMLWDFASKNSTWRPTAPSVAIARTRVTRPATRSLKALRLESRSRWTISTAG